MRPAIGLATAVVLAVALSSCASRDAGHGSTEGAAVPSTAGSATSAAGTSPIPWVDDPAPPYVAPSPAPLPTGARPCRPTDLTVTSPPHVGVALGNTNLHVTFTNSSTTTCALVGYPTIAGVSDEGTVTDLHARHGSYFGPPGPPANIAPGRVAAVNISGGDACTAAQQGRHRSYPWLRIGLPGGGFVTTHGVGFDTICGVSASSFGVPADRRPPMNPPPSPLRAVIHAPPTAHAGQPLTYSVTLTNTSGEPYGLRPCPAYQESVYAIAGQIANGVTKNYRLDCAAAHQIGAHASLTFAMRLQLPASLPATRTVKFDWMLQGESGPVANAPLRILP